MRQLMVRGVGLLVLAFLLVPAGFAKSPAKSKTKKSPKTADDTTATASDTKTDEAPPAAATALPAQQPAAKKKAADDEYKPAPKFTPLLATTGTLGLFTTETADYSTQGRLCIFRVWKQIWPHAGKRHNFQLGVDATYGITDRLSVYGSFAPYQHEHIGCGPQLSLAPPNNGGALYWDYDLPHPRRRYSLQQRYACCTFFADSRLCGRLPICRAKHWRPGQRHGWSQVHATFRAARRSSQLVAPQRPDHCDANQSGLLARERHAGEPAQ